MGCVVYGVSGIFRVAEDVCRAETEITDAEGGACRFVPHEASRARDELSSVGSTPQYSELVRIALNFVSNEWQVFV